MPYTQISDHLKRAVIASEDDSFVNHDGVDWNAIEKAWERNAQAEAQIAKAQARAPDKPVRAPKIRGGSTITQQLAKNLLLSGERTLLRKGQEFVLALLLEQLLSKQRILEIYLNNVEWGEGVFGAEAAEPATVRGTTFDKWTRQPGRDGDLFDCLVGCAVAASVLGLQWSAGGEAEARKPRRKINIEELYARRPKV